MQQCFERASRYISSIGLSAAELINEFAGIESTAESMKKKMSGYQARLLRIWDEDNNTISAAQYKELLEKQDGDFVLRFPKIAKLLVSICSILPTEALCERMFSIIKKIVHPQSSRMTVENAAAVLEVRFLSDQKVLAPEAKQERIVIDVDDDEDDDAVEIEDDDTVAVDGCDNDVDKKYEPRMTPEVCLDIVRFCVDDYQAVSNQNGNLKCKRKDCTSRWRKADIIDPTKVIQCNNQHCGTRWCLAKECVCTDNGLDEIPENDGQWKCRGCIRAMYKLGTK